MPASTRPPSLFPFPACLCSALLLKECGRRCELHRSSPSLEMLCAYIPRPVHSAIRRLRLSIPGSTDSDESDVELQHEFFLTSPALQREHDLNPLTLPAFLYVAVRLWLIERARRRYGRAPRGEAGFCAHAHKNGVGTVLCRKFAVTLDRTEPCKAHGHDGCGPCPHFRYVPPVQFVTAPDTEDPDWLGRQASAAGGDDPEAALLHAETLARLEAELKVLDELERQVLVHTFGLFDEEPKSRAEIAKHLDIPEGRVMVLRHRALTKLARR